MNAAAYFKTEQTTGRSIQRDRGIPENRWWVPIYREFRHHEEKIKRAPRVSDDFCEGTPEDKAFKKGREDVVDGIRTRGHATGAQHDAYLNGRQWQEARDRANGRVRKKQKTAKAILKEMRERAAQEREEAARLNQPPEPEPIPPRPLPVATTDFMAKIIAYWSERE